MAFWIITTFVHSENDFDFKKLPKYLKQNLWGIEAKNAVYPIKEGDRIVAYVGGKYARFFIFSAKIKGNKFKKSPTNLAPNTFYNPLLAGMEYCLALSAIKIFDKPLKIHEIRNKIDFLKNPAGRGMAMSQAMREISKEQFETILEYANKHLQDQNQLK